MAKQENESGRSLRLNIGDSQIELPMDSEGNVSMPEELKQIIAAGMTVLDKSNRHDDSQDVSQENEVTDAFRGLPMSELIGAPMYAAAQAQQRLSAIAWDYYQKIAFDDNKATRVLEFDIERPVIE